MNENFVGMHKSVRDKLEQPFPPEQVKHDVVRDDGFDPVYVEAATVIQRLNEAFESAWSFTILSHQFLPPSGTPTQVIVHGELKVMSSSNTINTIPLVKQQFGSCFLRPSRGGGFLDIGSDLKAAATDALKKCATMFGVALNLYQRDEAPMQGLHRKGNGTVQNGSFPQVQADPASRAMDFQIAEVNKLFERLGVPTAQWLQVLQFSSTDQIMVGHVNQILSGQHPWVQQLAASKGVAIGLQTSAA